MVTKVNIMGTARSLGTAGALRMKTLGARASSETQVAALEQLREVCPTAMVSAPGTQTPGEGMLTARSFVGISGSMSLTQSSAIAQFSKANGPTVSESLSALPIVSPGINNGFNQASILEPGRPPPPTPHCPCKARCADIGV